MRQPGNRDRKAVARVEPITGDVNTPLAPLGPTGSLCDDCGPSHWSDDGTKLLVTTGLPARVDMITLPSKVRTEVAMHPKYNLMRPQFSPDGRWIAFHA